jgi:hypothetical protein
MLHRGAFGATVIIGITAMLSLDCLAENASGQNTHPKIVEIDGSKTPSEIPQYLLWETTFRFLARRPSPENLPERSGIDIEASMPRADLLLIHAEAMRQLAAQSACGERLSAILGGLNSSNTNRDRIQDDLNRVMLECREASIVAGEQLANRLSRSGRTYFLNWVLERRKTITVSIPEEQLAFFKRPR